MKLVAFDGDHTLWTPLHGVCLSDRTPTDDTGWPHFTYKAESDNPLVIRRDDGARFALRPEAREVFEQLKQSGVLVGVVSYNHEANIRRALQAFGLADLVDFVVAEWHTNKDAMLGKMLAMAEANGHKLHACDIMLVDDDPEKLYRGQCERMGAGFVCFGSEIEDLREVAGMLGTTPTGPSE